MNSSDAWLVHGDLRLHPQFGNVVLSVLKAKAVADETGRKIAERLAGAADPATFDAAVRAGRRHLSELASIKAETMTAAASFRQAIVGAAARCASQLEEREAALAAAAESLLSGRAAQLDAQQHFFATALAQRRGSPTLAPSRVAASLQSWCEGPDALAWAIDPGRTSPAAASSPRDVVSLCATVATLTAALASANAAAATAIAGEAAAADKAAKLQKKLKSTERERQEKNEEVSRLHAQLRGAVDGLKKKAEDAKRAARDAEGGVVSSPSPTGTAPSPGGGGEITPRGGEDSPAPNGGGGVKLMWAPKAKAQAQPQPQPQPQAEADPSAQAAAAATSVAAAALSSPPSRPPAASPDPGRGGAVGGPYPPPSYPGLMGGGGYYLPEQQQHQQQQQHYAMHQQQQMQQHMMQYGPAGGGAPGAALYGQQLPFLPQQHAEPPPLYQQQQQQMYHHHQQQQQQQLSPPQFAGEGSTLAPPVAAAGAYRGGPIARPPSFPPRTLAAADTTTAAIAAATAAVPAPPPPDRAGAAYAAFMAAGEVPRECAPPTHPPGYGRTESGRLSLAPVLVPASESIAPGAATGARFMPTFRTAALVPFAVVDADSGDAAVDFEVDGIAEKGSRTLALLAWSRVLTDVLRAEAAAARAAPPVAPHLVELDRLMTLHAAVQATPGDVELRATLAAAGGDLLPALEALERQQHARHRHCEQGADTLTAILTSIGKPVGWVDDPDALSAFIAAPPLECERQLCGAIGAYETWQDDFLTALRPTMDVADGLLLQLYEALRVEEQTLAANEARVATGLLAAGNLLAAAEAFATRLARERDHRAFEYTRTLREECVAMLVAAAPAPAVAKTQGGVTTHGTVGGALAGEAAALRESLLEAREKAIKMRAELDVLRLRGCEPKLLAAGERHAARHDDHITALTAAQRALVDRLRGVGVTEPDVTSGPAARAAAVAAARRLSIELAGPGGVATGGGHPEPSLSRSHSASGSSSLSPPPSAPVQLGFLTFTRSGSAAGGSSAGVAALNESSRALNLKLGSESSAAAVHGGRLSRSTPARLLSGALEAARRNIAERIVSGIAAPPGAATPPGMSLLR